jgi:uncharacterized YkwD family protein
MKRKIVILAALAVFLVSSTCYAATADSGIKTELAFEKMDNSAATVTVSRLNLREGPSTSFPSICKLEKGQAVTVIGKLGDWYAVYNITDGIVGAVDGRYISLEEATPASLTASNPDVKTVEASKNKTDDKTNEKTIDKANDKSKEKVAPKTTPAKGATPSAINVDLSQDEQKLLELVNKARADEGLEQLTIDENLMKVAREKAKDMTVNSYFSHQSPTYGSPFDMMRQFDNVFKSAGENIAGNKTVEGAFKAWMASDSHKKNILNSGFKVTGIGVESSETYGKVFVQQFIGR